MTKRRKKKALKKAWGLLDHLNPLRTRERAYATNGKRTAEIDAWLQRRLTT